MSLNEKIKELKQKAHDANDKYVMAKHDCTIINEELNTLYQEKYAPLVGKAFVGKDWTMDEDGHLAKPREPFFVYSLPPITWDRCGMSFNPYQLPILGMSTDNECGGVEVPVLMIDTLFTDAFKADDVYEAFTQLYKEISLQEFNAHVNEVVGDFLVETKDNADHFILEGDE